MEQINSVSITISIDTNKQTYKSEFNNVEDAIEFYNITVSQINQHLVQYIPVESEYFERLEESYKNHPG